ncbi:ribonucleoside-triphosphate reductase, adenosylcobalamin-dependent [Microtetraspora malaysiensis]|uniref:ribonucleoside-triphosphate reductase, adenosylcobalamin-dependent n=1 Tax=Microtetraspora malaysiensis TaxID=161358 RepID=UPI003D8E88F3
MAWGPNGQAVYERTYSRPLPDGTQETWPETVDRVVDGNTSLIRWKNHNDYYREFVDLTKLIESFALIPAGRHLWMSGVKGNQHLFNCWVSGWYENVSDHFRFTLMRLAEGGGVGANYASKYLHQYGPVAQPVTVHVVCDPMHRDYQAMKDSGVLSDYYSPDYTGSYFEVEDSREGWADALADLIEAAWNPDASDVRVYDVSRVRCRGSRIKGFGGTASGPEPLAEMLHDVSSALSSLAWGIHDPGGRFRLTLDPLTAMEIDHAIGKCVVAGGVRRSARMSILPIDDPWFDEFLTCKADTSKHWTTNISVAVDDGFLARLDSGDEEARGKLRRVAEAMLTNGEPGIWNYSLSQVGEVDEIIATNPCGEIPLTGDGEPCNLGHVNLDAFAPQNPGDPFDLLGACNAAKLMTRFLIRATYGDVTDARSRAVLDRNRRIGVGLLGFQAAFAKMGIPYSKIPESFDAEMILLALKGAVRSEARRYASELRIPEPIKATTVAPTGSVAMLPGTTPAIQPIYARHFIRRIRFSTVSATEREMVERYRAQGYHVEPDLEAPNTMIVEIPTVDPLVEQVEALGYPAEVVESQDEISLETMLAVQAMVQESYADNAVSFTVNVPVGAYEPDDLVTALTAYLPRLKGTTVMPDGTRPQAPFERLTREEYEALTGPKAVGDSIDEECATGACPIR